MCFFYKKKMCSVPQKKQRTRDESVTTFSEEINIFLASFFFPVVPNIRRRIPLTLSTIIVYYAPADWKW